MNEMRRIPIETLAEGLRAGAACPETERLVMAVAGELPAAERERLLAHAAACPACAAELELARGFERAPEAEETADVAWIVEQVERRRREQAPVAKVLPMRPRRAAGAPGRWTAWAAAAALALAVGLSFWAVRDGGGPGLPDRSYQDALRGGSIAWTTPLGTLAAAPSEISWEPVAGAASYRVEILDVAGRPVLDATPGAPEWNLTAAERTRLETFVLYRVRVSALDASGRELAASELADLRLEPAR
jgi:hypothetical protein